MRKRGWKLALAAVVGLSVLLTASLVAAQWGLIQQGVDAAKGAKQAQEKPAAQEDPNAPLNFANDPQTGPVSTAPVTYKNSAYNFSYTIPAGWKRTEGSPNSKMEGFGKPGTTWFFHYQITRMVPSFPAKASVDASLKTAKEEVTIGRLMSAKRRDDGGGLDKKGVIGWEIVESREGGGGSHQRIIWQCYDAQNNYYNFSVVAHPDQFPAARAELQRIMDSIKFGR